MGPSATDVFPEKGRERHQVLPYRRLLKRPGIAPSIDLDGCLFWRKGWQDSDRLWGSHN